MIEDLLKFLDSSFLTNIIIAFFTGLYAWTYRKQHKSTIPTVTKFIYNLDDKCYDSTIVNNASHNIAIKDVYVLKKKYLIFQRHIKKGNGNWEGGLRYFRLIGWIKITGKWKILELNGEESSFTSISNEHIINFTPEKKLDFICVMYQQEV